MYPHQGVAETRARYVQRVVLRLHTPPPRHFWHQTEYANASHRLYVWYLADPLVEALPDESQSGTRRQSAKDAKQQELQLFRIIGSARRYSPRNETRVLSRQVLLLHRLLITGQESLIDRAVGVRLALQLAEPDAGMTGIACLLLHLAERLRQLGLPPARHINLV